MSGRLVTNYINNSLQRKGMQENNHRILVFSTLCLFVGLFFFLLSAPLSERGIVSITGAGIADFNAGKMGTLSLFFILFILANVLAVVGFATYFLKSIHNTHVEFQLRDAVHDLFLRIKHWIVR